MHIHPGENEQIARLLGFLIQGERLAETCAARQAALTSQPGMRRFLLAQSRQEALHAAVFENASAWLAPARKSSPPMLVSMQRYSAHIDAALCAGDLAETLLAQQVILEGLGEVVLTNIAVGIQRRNGVLQRLHRSLLHQEQAHHSFGMTHLKSMQGAGLISAETLRCKAHWYLDCAEDMLDELQGQFDYFDEDATQYKHALRAHLAGLLA